MVAGCLLAGGLPVAHAQSAAGTALRFDGIDDYVMVPHDAALNAYPLTITASNGVGTSANQSFTLNVTSTQAMMLRLAQLQDEGVMLDEHASLAKAFCTVKCRETVGYARELLGGNGILLENHIGRFVADAEAIYSYEGTREMNTLIVGKSITGLSAFV